jgi:hypothetical protein
MPTYEFSAPHDATHVVVADRYERDHGTVTFVNVETFDGNPYSPYSLSLPDPGPIAIIDE